MKKYLPIKVNGEWCLKSKNDFIERTKAWYDFEKEANAKPIINHDGREWYEESELEEVWQWKDPVGVKWETEIESGHDASIILGMDTRQAWKYIGEKTVEKAYNPQDETVRNAAMVEMGVADESDLFGTDNSFVSGAEFGSEHERTRIIGLINDELKQCPSKHFNLYEDLLTKINNNGK